ncbi:MULTISPECIES: competence type IV pilus ATPase ComGA [Bacillus]|uniref:Competence protein ComG n=2 Tax=Bacillus TaxID=1386 RepID=A0A0M4FGG8_9BACI|nr:MULTISPECIES: competence type IV pilus ATPase ComGA [Bacillus]ALC81611.1 competence protein ComG [Bacillus gobiensis]MBP1080648.1 competence protein ComGA [Bacillus capparidis]MED1094505.1 competence type IV pilus ATPase ComGA [Bacillus capparidis]
MYEIETLSDRLIDEACKLRASDIHIVPREKDAVVHYRIDDDLIRMKKMKREESHRLISHFKFLASMDIGERRKPQNGSLSVKREDASVHLRLSTLPTVYDESLVIRVLPQERIPPLNKLSLFSSSTAKILSLLNHSHGLFLFTGPTGSGKSTTLYSLIRYAKENFNRNIITLEDPVETKSEDILQVQVNEKAGITYASGLKAILRHDPDMIILGEIRDAETAKIAIRAALTGHLVLSTMHTKDAKGAIYRLLEFGIKLSEIEQTLIAVAAQRLVDLRCPYCTEKPCSVYCKLLRNTRRASVYELLYGKSLSLCMKEAQGEHAVHHYVTLKRLMQKGVALGYLTDKTYFRWVLHEVE